MDFKYPIESRPPLGQLLLYSLQWFVLAVAVVVTSLFISVGSPGERVLYAQKVFALMGATTILQLLIGHRMPIVVGPAAVLLVGIITALASQGGEVNTNKIYTSIAVGGVAVVLLSMGRLLQHLQRIFTPRIVVVILMLIAVTLTNTIKNLIFTGDPSQNAFGLWFALLGVPMMALASTKLKGVAKSLLIPISLLAGSVIYYSLYGGLGEAISRFGEPKGELLLPALEFDWSMIVAFLLCYIALLINDVGSMQALGTMLSTPDTDKRCRRGVAVTGITNIIAGGIGVIGPVNYSMSPAVIASSSCASRWALLPVGIGLILCAFSPSLIAIMSAMPDRVIGVILLYLMGTQLAASFSMMTSTKSALTFEDCMVLGLPIMVALVFGVIPMEVIPSLLRPILGNGFVMGVLCVMLLEHLIYKKNNK